MKKVTAEDGTVYTKLKPGEYERTATGTFKLRKKRTATNILSAFTVEDLLREAMRRSFTHVDMNDASLQETPGRVARFWKEFNQETDTKALLKRTFDNGNGTRGMVAQSDIPFRALCEHHLLPFYGVVHLAYIPKGHVVGLSKLARVVKALGARRPTVQETITEELANMLYKDLDALGAAVVVKAEHTCMSVRGACTPGVVTTTSAVKGLFRDAPHVRQEFFTLIGLKGA